jgi:ABC-type transport system involved in cytochrome c biogenesis permease subunit
MNSSNQIYFLIFSLLSLIPIAYWGYIAWRHPIKLKEKFFSDLGKWFVPVLWFYRITFSLFGLILIFIVLVTSLPLLGFE